MRKSTENQLNTLDAELKLLLRDLKKFTDSDLNWKPGDGKWSVHQIMEHLMIAEDLSLKYVQRKLSFEPKLKRAGIMGAFRASFVRMYLRSPLKVKAPEMVGKEVLSENAAFWDLVKQWKSQREELRTYLGDLPDDMFKKGLYKHPLAGRMSLGGMLSFYIGHFRRHRKQIETVLKNFKY